jgi:hypothetical protein
MVGQAEAMVWLLPLKDDGCSLEFAPEDIDRVSAALSSRFGSPRVTKHPTLTVYSFGGTELTFQNEWDEPCLIASTPDGVTMLKAVLEDLTASSA